MGVAEFEREQARKGAFGEVLLYIEGLDRLAGGTQMTDRFGIEWLRGYRQALASIQKLVAEEIAKL